MIIRSGIIAIACLVAAGCAHRPVAVNQCVRDGYKPGTELYLRCKAIAAQIEAQQYAARQAAGDELMAAGLNMMRASERRPVICNTSPGPVYGATTTCY